MNWKLTPVKSKARVVYHEPIIDPQSGRRAGIQRGPSIEAEPVASDQCPICVVEGWHQHTVEDLEALRRMVAFLESKLGVDAASRESQ